MEFMAYAENLEEEVVNIPTSFSFRSKDGTNCVVCGDPIIECSSIVDSCKEVVGMGINCTPLRYIQGLIQSIRKLITCNSGDTYDGEKKE
ncbi:hypothetical protein KY290_037568 [Solanum tuberosum]|uniref:Hcy-binding domain-containing protein n=1 Tax=Solanum tuberosum TaxID=4113 RepID=A0ABQ7TXB4_SOLTU|nr:hypothetical protein KY284_036923 [Solanum tuberosum]KAH0640286.1 hypothetical protein KY285_036872 [Solanum tuberosum]KAH0738863.1 hypothetical protein KY290_037568 [Solanum tuberosum]